MQLSNRLAIDESRHIDASSQNIECIGVLVRNGTVHVPVEIGHLLEEIGADNLTEFVSALSSLPTAFARQCHLTDEEFAAARSKIFNDLRINGADSTLFESEEPFDRGMGALPPLQANND